MPSESVGVINTGKVSVNVRVPFASTVADADDVEWSARGHVELGCGGDAGGSFPLRLDHRKVRRPQVIARRGGGGVEPDTMVGLPAGIEDWH